MSVSGPDATAPLLPTARQPPRTFFERTPPDLVVEAEIASIDEGKIARYGEMGVRELWRLHGRKGSRDLRVEFIGLRPGTAPCRLDASEVLGALTPDDVHEAVDDMRLGLTHEERTATVARIVRRRQRASVRVREVRRRLTGRPLRMTTALVRPVSDGNPIDALTASAPGYSGIAK